MSTNSQALRTWIHTVLADQYSVSPTTQRIPITIAPESNDRLRMDQILTITQSENPFDAYRDIIYDVFRDWQDDSQ